MEWYIEYQRSTEIFGGLKELNFGCLPYVI